MRLGAAAELALDLVRVPSPSGDEGRVAGVLEGRARDAGLDVTRDENGVQIVVQGERAGPTLLLASHLDTVPPGEGWTVDPHEGVVHEGVLVARGAVDAKASVAAMVEAARALEEQPSFGGCLVVLATFCEETRDTTMPRALESLAAKPDAAFVGEPTRLEPCVAQRGLMIAEATWKGEQVHAGWASERSVAPKSAVASAARDLARLDELEFERQHGLLGRTAVAVTQLHAGVARNVTPPTCTALLDIRTTPAYGHDELAAILRETLPEADLEIVSTRLEPAATPEGSKLLKALERVRPDARPFGSPTTSDWVWMRKIDAIKLGPGDSRQSHRPDESIRLSEIDEAAALYASVAREYLS